MKRIIAILLAMLCIFSLVACGEDDKKDNDEDKSGTLAGSGKEFSLGKADGSVWENEYLGIGCEIPSGWTFKSEEEIAALNGISAELMGDDVKALIESADIVYDMYANNEDMSSNINVNLEKVNELQIKMFDAKTTAEAAYSIVKDSYKNLGFETVETSFNSFEVDGKDCSGMRLEASIGDVTLYLQQFNIVAKSHIASITVTALSEQELQNILNCFYWLPA